MRTNFVKATFTVAAALGLSLTAFGQAPSAVLKIEPPKEIPRLPNGKPDMSGLWQKPYVPDMTNTNKDGKTQVGPKELPFTAWGKKEWETYHAEEGDYAGSCLPFGQMRSMNSPEPAQFLQNDKYIAFLYEQNSWFHVVPTDGRKHQNGTATWFGDSVGRWEGDTLVVETNNFNGKTRLDTIGHPHSDQLSIVEKFTRTDPTHIAYEIDIHDPKTFTADWKNTRIFTLRTDWEIMEYSCEENNKSLWEGRIKAPNFDNLGK